MRKSLASYIKALSAVIASILITFVAGSFMGTPINPTVARHVQAQMDVAVKTGMVFREGDAEAYFAVPSTPNPPFWVAVLDWNAWLLAPLLILALLVLRPAEIPSIIVTCGAAFILYYLAAPTTALVLLVSAAIGTLGICGLGKLKELHQRKKNSP